MLFLALTAAQFGRQLMGQGCHLWSYHPDRLARWKQVKRHSPPDCAWWEKCQDWLIGWNGFSVALKIRNKSLAVKSFSSFITNRGLGDGSIIRLLQINDPMTNTDQLKVFHRLFFFEPWPASAITCEINSLVLYLICKPSQGSHQVHRCPGSVKIHCVSNWLISFYPKIRLWSKIHMQALVTVSICLTRTVLLHSHDMCNPPSAYEGYP